MIERQFTQPKRPWKKVFLVLLVMIGLVFQNTPTSLAAELFISPATEPENVALKMVSNDQQGVTLELILPDFQISQRIVNGKSCTQIRLEGMGTTDQVGWPELPVSGGLVGIPANAAPTLKVIEAKPATIIGKYDLCPLQAPIDEILQPEGLPALEDKVNRVPEGIRKAAYWPGQVVELGPTELLRNQEVVFVRFLPFQYFPGSGELQVYRRIVARIEFNAPSQSQKQGRNAGADLQEAIYTGLLQDALINYEQAAAWETERTVEIQLKENTSFQAQPAVKLYVEQDGIYQVTFEDLSQVVGVNLLTGVATETIQMFLGGDYTRGQEIAIKVVDNEDGVFDPGDYLIFCGQKVDTRYSGTNVYFLTWNGGKGLRMEVVDAFPTGPGETGSFRHLIRLEQNRLYLSNFPSGRNSDVWYGDYVQNSASKFYNLTITSLAKPEDGVARLKGLLRSYSGTPQHHTRIYINDNLIDDAFWAIGSSYTLDREFPLSYLVEGDNTIKLENLLDSGITAGIVLINWFEIEYLKSYIAEGDRLDFKVNEGETFNLLLSGFTTDQLEVFDTSDPVRVRELIGGLITEQQGKYNLTLATSNGEAHTYTAQARNGRTAPQRIERDSITALRSPSNGADYIIISHSDFLPQVQPLADWRTAQGLRTIVVDVADIYDEFNGGVISPQAIRDFLSYAFANWQSPAPLYVLLVGDGNYDPRDYLGTGTKTFIPPYLDFVDHWIGEAASDNRFVSVNGSDFLPDMIIGRLPVTTTSQTTAAVAKIISYEQIPPETDWNSRALFIADNADAAGDFAMYSEKVIGGYLPTSYLAQKIYFGITHFTVSSARSDILNGFNQGALLVNYVGHGSVQSWATETLFSNNSVASLSNTGRLPFVASLSCLVGSFAYPNLNGTETSALAEQLVVKADGGAIAVFASAGMGLASGQDYLNQGLFQAMFQQEKKQVGDAALAAKLYLYAKTGGSYQDLIDLFTLFGDPATRLQVLPKPDVAKDASIGDLVWDDANGNGIQDFGETGVAGVMVNLYKENGELSGSSVTNEVGVYAFLNLEPGNYFLKFIPPVGYGFSLQDGTVAPDKDSDVKTPDGWSVLFSLSASQQDQTRDAGLIQQARLGDWVWEDLNANGVQEFGEPGIPGVLVSLYNDVGELVDSVTTDMQGSYSFSDIQQGNYKLKFFAPAGYAFSPRILTVDEAKDSDVVSWDGFTEIFQVEPGTYDEGKDAGLYRLAALGDRVWEDLNGNGMQDPGEPGLAGVVVRLFSEAGELVGQAVTNWQGGYLFENLLPGRYSLAYALPDGYLFTDQKTQENTDFDSDVDPISGRSAWVTLQSGQQDTAQDAGAYKTATLGDFVWLDRDGDGVQDKSEKGVGGVQVSLYTADGRLLATTTTDRLGRYSFSALKPGSYYLVYSLPKNYKFTVNNLMASIDLNSDVNPAGQTQIFDLVSGQVDTSWDAGLIAISRKLR